MRNLARRGTDHGGNRSRSRPRLVRLGAIGLLLAAALVPARAATTAATDVCSPAGATPVKILAVEPGFELAGDDGRRFLPAGIDLAAAAPSDDAAAEANRQTIAAWLVGHEVLVRPIGASPDRWGRVPAAIFAPQDFSPAADAGGQDLTSVSEALVEAGFARVAPQSLSPACALVLLEAEDGARADSLGLWADADNAVVAATDSEALAAKAGSDIIAEGEVLSLGAGTSRFYLNFGPRGAGDLSVSILRRDAAKFDRAGMPLASLPGSVIRVRGLLDSRFGPEIGIAGPQAIERVGPQQNAARL